jgi:hypothetical protein
MVRFTQQETDTYQSAGALDPNRESHYGVLSERDVEQTTSVSFDDGEALAAGDCSCSTGGCWRASPASSLPASSRPNSTSSRPAISWRSELCSVPDYVAYCDRVLQF